MSRARRCSATVCSPSSTGVSGALSRPVVARRMATWRARECGGARVSDRGGGGAGRREGRRAAAGGGAGGGAAGRAGGEGVGRGGGGVGWAPGAAGGAR